jgi:hypothetical protein
VTRYGLAIITASEEPLYIPPAPNTIIAKAAPKAAAVLIPSVKGDPRGFRRTLCITTPLTAKAIPVIIPARTLGNLILKIILL